MLTCAASKGELGTRARPPESDSELPRGLGKLCPLNAFAAKGLSSTLCPSLQVRKNLERQIYSEQLGGPFIWQQMTLISGCWKDLGEDLYKFAHLNPSVCFPCWSGAPVPIMFSRSCCTAQKDDANHLTRTVT